MATGKDDNRRAMASARGTGPLCRVLSLMPGNEKIYQVMFLPCGYRNGALCLCHGAPGVERCLRQHVNRWISG